MAHNELLASIGFSLTFLANSLASVCLIFQLFSALGSLIKPKI